MKKSEDRSQIVTDNIVEIIRWHVKAYTDQVKRDIKELSYAKLKKKYLS